MPAPSEGPEPSDQALVRACLAGRAAAFDDLVRRYQGPLFRFLKRHTGTAGDALDLVQDTFLRAYQALARYDSSRSFATWIFTIARRLAADLGTSARVVRSVPLEEPGPGAGDPVAALPSPVDPAQLAENRLLLARLAEEVGLLPAIYRDPFLLRYQESLEIGEIASILQLTEATVKVRLFRARELLRARLGDWLQGGR